MISTMIILCSRPIDYAKGDDQIEQLFNKFSGNVQKRQ